MTSRLQRRCFVTSAVVHFALGLLLVLAPAFRNSTKLADDGAILEMIPGELIDAALAPGFVAAEPPERAAPTEPQEREPEPEPTPPAKVPREEISFDLPKAREPGFTLPNARLDETPKEKPNKPEREPVKIDLSKVKPFRASDAARDRKKPAPEVPAGPTAEELARQRRQELLKTLDGASGRIAGAVTRGTVQIQTGPPGGGGGGGGGAAGGAGGSTYAWHVRNAFNNAWISPQNVKDDLATVDLEVVIRRDGRVLRASIAKRSGISALDRSVQDAADRVREIIPFEAGASEDQRTYTIGFNLRARRSF